MDKKAKVKAIWFPNSEPQRTKQTSHYLQRDGTLAAVCNVKHGDSTTLEHVGRYAQCHDVGILAQITWLRALRCARGTSVQSCARDGPMTSQGSLWRYLDVVEEQSQVAVGLPWLPPEMKFLSVLHILASNESEHFQGTRLGSCLAP